MKGQSKSDPSLYGDFADFALNAESWFQTADNLWFSAEQLEPAIEEFWRRQREWEQKRRKGRTLVPQTQPDPRGIHFMLVAFACENLCKGLIVAKEKEGLKKELVAKGRLPERLKSHNLEQLLDDIKFPLNTADRELASRLERAAVWSARYPAPVSPQQRAVFLVEGKATVPPWHKEDDVAAVKDFFARLDQYISQQWYEI